MAMLHPELAASRRATPRTHLTTGLLIAGAFHAGLAAWLMHQSFTPHLEADEPRTGVFFVDPPPPPEPPPTEIKRPRPPTLAPHKVASTYPTPDRLDVAPVKHPQPTVETPPVVASVETPVVDPTPAVVTPPVAAPDPVVRPPALLRRPSAADLARFYPDRALRLEREGRTEVACLVDAAGAAQACRLLSETPVDLGFGKAALDIARTFRFSPKTVDGKAVGGGEVRLPLRWTLDG